MEGGSKQAPIAKRLEGKVALITGGGSGNGAATVRLFARHGAKVVIADIQDHLGKSIAQELGGDQNVKFVHCDISNETEVKNAVDTTVMCYGKLDIMYNNAAIGGDTPQLSVLDTPSEDFKRVFDVNVHGQFLGAKHAARVMIPAKQGTIIFTSSTSSVLVGTPHSYTVSKHAVVGLSKSLCAELGQYGIRVNCVAPYAVATPIMKRYITPDGEVAECFRSAACLKGLVLKAEDVAESVLYLASDEAKYVTGINLLVDGGYTIINPVIRG